MPKRRATDAPTYLPTLFELATTAHKSNMAQSTAGQIERKHSIE